MLAVRRRLVRVETLMDEPDMTRPVDQHRGGHVADAILGSDGPVAVVNHGQPAAHFAEERLSLGPRPIEVDRHQREITPRILAVEACHIGKGQLARAAPACPEINIDNFAPIGAKVELCGFCKSRRRRKKRERPRQQGNASLSDFGFKIGRQQGHTPSLLY